MKAIIAIVNLVPNSLCSTCVALMLVISTPEIRSQGLYYGFNQTIIYRDSLSKDGSFPYDTFQSALKAVILDTLSLIKRNTYYLYQESFGREFYLLNSSNLFYQAGRFKEVTLNENKELYILRESDSLNRGIVPSRVTMDTNFLKISIVDRGMYSRSQLPFLNPKYCFCSLLTGGEVFDNCFYGGIKPVKTLWGNEDCYVWSFYSEKTLEMEVYVSKSRLIPIKLVLYFEGTTWTQEIGAVSTFPLMN